MKMNNESGRSMVEMLGVLAIIGVLSIGGIAGYTMAMNRYRANELIDAASKVAIVAMTANAGVGQDDTDLEDAGIANVPCADTIVSTAKGVVTVTIDGDCDGVAAVMNTLAGNKASACADQSCTLDFSGSTGSAS